MQAAISAPQDWTLAASEGIPTPSVKNKKPS